MTSTTGLGGMGYFLLGGSLAPGLGPRRDGSKAGGGSAGTYLTDIYIYIHIYMYMHICMN